MNTYLFCFGYESPEEWRSNQRSGTDFESSNAVWVEAPSEDDALKAGIDFAENWVSGVFEGAGVADFSGWTASGYAHWIEGDPENRGSHSELAELSRIRADC